MMNRIQFKNPSALWRLPVLAAAIAFAPGIVVAQSFPNRPIEISVWAAAGGGTDATNRLIAKVMEKELGVSIVVSNRTGGGGAVAMNHVWSKPHDGYNWLGASEAMQNAAVMGYHPTKTKDWRWYIVAGGPGSLAVKADSPYKTYEDLVKAAQANPGKVNITHCPIGCVFHLKAIALADATKTKLNFVPYTGSAPAMVAVLSGDGAAVISSIAEQAEYIKGGKLRSLGMVEVVPFTFEGATLPAIGAKYPDIGKMPARQWLGFAVPGDTPKAVTDRIDAAYVKAITNEEVKATAARQYNGIIGLHGNESMKVLSAMESAVGWKLQEMGIAKVSPDSIGIPKP